MRAFAAWTLLGIIVILVIAGISKSPGSGSGSTAGSGTTSASSYVDEMTPTRLAKAVISLRGAACGEVVGAAKDGATGNVVAQCSNGMFYVIVKAGTGYALARRNTLTGKLEPI